MADTRIESEELLQLLGDIGQSIPSESHIATLFALLNTALHDSIQSLPHTETTRTSVPQIICKQIGIPVQGRPVRVAVFGTISSDVYQELVWESIQRIPSFKDYGAGVHEVRKLPSLRFVILFERLEWEVEYWCVGELVRNYGEELLTATYDEILDSCSDQVAKSILDLAEKTRVITTLDAIPNGRKTFHLCRSWASLIGVLDETTETEILRFLSSAGKQSRPLPSVISQLLRQAGSRPLFQIPDPEWLQWLISARSQSVATTIGKPQYLVIEVTYSGCSNIQAGKWLRYIQSRLSTLEKALTSTLSIRYKGIGDFSVFPWQGRLVHINSDPQASTYEGFYVFGLNDGEDTEEAVHKWLSIIERHENTLPHRCFITSASYSSSEFKAWESYGGNLQLCLKKYPKALLSPPNPLDLDPDSEDIFPSPSSSPEEGCTLTRTLTSRPPKKSKITKQALRKSSSSVPSQSHQSTQDNLSEIPKSSISLRPASHIISRLHHDPKIDIDEYIMGYEDRFLKKTVEIPACEWVRRSDDERFIPEGRVRWFKRLVKDGAVGGEEGRRWEVVWDRQGRIDRIFGSGIKLEDEEDIEEEQEREFEKEEKEVDVGEEEGVDEQVGGVKLPSG